MVGISVLQISGWRAPDYDRFPCNRFAVEQSVTDRGYRDGVGLHTPSRRMALVRMAAALVFLNAVVACDQASEPVTSQFLEGREFPPALLAIISGEEVASESLRGKMLVLNVWATWCAPCRHEMPSLNRLSKMLDPQKFAVVGVSTDADALLVSEFLLQNGIAYANFLDLNGKVVRQLGLRTYPETFVIAPDRTLVRRLTGLREWSSPEMVKFIEGLYPAQPGSGPTRPDVLR